MLYCKTDNPDGRRLVRSIGSSPPDGIKAKVLWLLGEMGLKYPQQIKPFIDPIAKFLKSKNEKIRERAIGALGRIGRADHKMITPYWKEILKMAYDPIPDVRMNFIWASENIATNAPALFENIMDHQTTVVAEPARSDYQVILISRDDLAKGKILFNLVTPDGYEVDYLPIILE